MPETLTATNDRTHAVNEHDRLAREIATGIFLGVTSPTVPGFVEWEPVAGRPDLTPHARVVDLSEAPAGLLDPFLIQEADPLTADERRAVAVDTLRALTISATDDTVADASKDQP